MTAFRLAFLPADPDGQGRYIDYGAEGHVLSHGALAYGQPAPPPAPTILALPGTDVLAQRMSLPSASRSQAEAAARLLLADEMAVAAEPLRIAVSDPLADGTRWAAGVAEARLSHWLETARGMGVEPGAVVPEFLLLALAETDEGLTSLNLGDRVLMRGQDLACSVEPDLVALIAGDRPVVPLELGERLDRLLGQAARAPVLDLMPRARDGGLDLRRLRLPALLALALVLTWPILMLATALQNDAAARRAEAETQALAQAALARRETIADPVGEVRQARLAQGAVAGFAPAAAGLFAAIETVEGAGLEGLLYDAQGTLRATISYRDYADVETLRAAALDRGLVLEEQSAIDDRGVRVGDFLVRPQ